WACWSLTILRARADQIPPVLIDASDTYRLNGYVGYYEDSTLTATPDQVLALKDQGVFTAFNGDEYVSLGYTDSYYWVVIDLRNTLHEYVDLFLSVPVASINILELYQRRAADSS